MKGYGLEQLHYDLNTISLLLFGVLTLFMLTGWVFYIVGHVRTKNVTSLLAQTIIGSITAILIFIFFGQQFLYNAPIAMHGFLGYFSSLFHTQALPSVINVQTGYSPNAELFFHMCLPAITLCLIAGCLAERIKFTAFLLFAIFTTAFILSPLYCWLWGHGFLFRAGFIDESGAGMVYLSGATAGWVGLMMIGPRKDKYAADGQIRTLNASSTPLIALGSLLLMIGSFGFNAGVHFSNAPLVSAHVFAGIMMNTVCSGASGMMMAFIITRLAYGTIDLTFVSNGLVAGLAALAADPVHPSMALAAAIGGIAALFAIISINLFERYRLDDPVGIVGSAGIGSLWGLLAATFSSHLLPELNQTGIQLLGIAVILLWVGLMTFLTLTVIRYTIGLRVDVNQETRGSDILECGMPAYGGIARSAE